MSPKNPPAVVATQPPNEFPAVRFSLLVGIGGVLGDHGKNDIRLSDVVVC